jgi:hypothetical protein
MALTAELEALIASLPEADRETTRQLLEKHPSLREGYLRQEDYNRLSNKTKAEQAEATKAKERYEADRQKNDEWFKESKPLFDKMKGERDTFSARVTELEAKMKTMGSAAAAATGGDGTDAAKLVEQVAERMKSMNVVPTEEKLRSMFVEEATKKAMEIAENERKAFVTQTLPATMEYIMQINEIALDYKDEFGEKFDRKAFIEFQKEKGMIEKPPRETFDEYVRDRRAKKHDEDLIAKTTKDVESRLSVPGSGSNGSSGLPGTSAVPENGPVVEYLKSQNQPAPGTGASEEAAKAAAALRAAGKY